MSSPLLAWRFRMLKMMSCLRERATFSRPISRATSNSSVVGLVLSSVRFIGLLLLEGWRDRESRRAHRRRLDQDAVKSNGCVSGGLVRVAGSGAEQSGVRWAGRLLDHRHNRRGCPASLLGRLAASAPGAFFAPACRSGVWPGAPRRPPGRGWSGSEGTVDEGGQLALGNGADLGGLGLAALEQNQRGNAADAVLGRALAVGVDIHLADLDLACVVPGNFVEDGRNHLAGPAPLGPEVHQYGLVGLQYFGFKAGVGDVDNGVAHLGSPWWV